MMGPTCCVWLPSESVAVTCSVYEPGAANVTYVTACCGAEKVTAAGPLLTGSQTVGRQIQFGLKLLW